MLLYITCVGNGYFNTVLSLSSVALLCSKLKAEGTGMERKGPGLQEEVGDKSVVHTGSSLMVQWLRLYVPNKGGQVPSLVRELDSTCHN